jgi:asparagine synthetase B (glutamine-hydrolysing)
LCGDFIELFVHENSPHCNAFSLLKHRLYQAAAEKGCRLMMVGDAGDNLYGQQEYWLRDLIAGGHPSAFAEPFARTVWRAGRGNQFARASLRHLLPGTATPRPKWLTREALALLPPPTFSPITPEGKHKARFDASVNPMWIELESEERRLFAQCGIGRSNPFWYWPLLQNTLNLSASWFYRDGVSKVLAREAMKGRLPERVLNSKRVGLLGWFFLRGLEQNRKMIKDLVFMHPRSDWPRYVKRAWLEPYLLNNEIAFGHTILWRVICYELWCRRRMGLL